MSISEQVHVAGRKISAAADSGIASALNCALSEFLGDDFKSMAARVVDSRKTQSADFASVIYQASARVDAGEPAAIPADVAAAVVAACAELTVDGLCEAYARIAHAKTLKKAPVRECESAWKNDPLGARSASNFDP